MEHNKKITNQTKIGINICKKLIFSKNLIQEPHVRVFQKLQKYFFIDQYQKFTDQTKIGADSIYGSGVQIHKKVILAKIS
jgi:hypothetical protein